MILTRPLAGALVCALLLPASSNAAKSSDAKNRETGNEAPSEDPALKDYGIYGASAPRPGSAPPVETALPLELREGERIVFIGNTLFDRGARFPHFESLLQQAHPGLDLSLRTLAWSADEVDLMPRPDNFGDIHQHLFAQKADVIFAAFGFNESFGGIESIPTFKERLTGLLTTLRNTAYNGESAPRVVLVSPIANENIDGVPAADLNADRLAAFTKAMAEVAGANDVAFVDVFTPTSAPMADASSDLTMNGVHLNDAGYREFADALFRGTFGASPPGLNPEVYAVIKDKNDQFFRRYRPLNTFYYTGGRNKSYGYLDFLPAMRNFDLMVEEREARARDLAAGKSEPHEINDAALPELGPVVESRGANEWLAPEDELAAFNIDPRVEVNLFASEVEFPDIACPIQIRWDSRGRLWVSCSTTYPHVYPGQDTVDKIVILEDTDSDGKADTSTVFADDLHIPLSFVLTPDETGIYVSEEPHLTLVEDTDGDGKADRRTELLTGFGTEDSHHALHDFTWTPDGDLLFRESIFHNTQTETPYGPVRAKNSAWFQFDPRTHRLTSFGGYPNTNPWGVVFTEWGHHVASHPIFAAAFHATNAPYPVQHPKASGIPAYSGVCGHDFVDWECWPEEMRGGMVKARYKPTNRIEFHRWVDKGDHFAEEYEADLIFSTNLSFIPVDCRFGPRGALYICDWYNPVKGHAQYSLRDPRRDRSSGRIWRITPKDSTLPPAPDIAGATTGELVEMLGRPESRIRQWVRRELRARPADEVATALENWLADRDPSSPRYDQNRVEALWVFRSLRIPNDQLLESLLTCEEPLARAAAVRMLRHATGAPAVSRLARAATDPSAYVRMEAAMAASHQGTREAFTAILPSLPLVAPEQIHLQYATATALGSEALLRHRDETSAPAITAFLTTFAKQAKRKAGGDVRNANDSNFDAQKDLAKIEISCLPERLLFTVDAFSVKAGQPVKLVFSNPDATPHNLVIVQPGATEEIGMAGNEMAKDPAGITKHFVPESKKILHHTKLLAPDTTEVLRFRAPKTPGKYPYLCTFPGHWIVMRGMMTVEAP